MARIRVLHVVESFSTGVLQSISLICNNLGGDAEFSILYGQRDETPADFQARFHSVECFVPWGARREIDASNDWRALRELRQFVRQWKPDIVHAHSSKAGALARLLTLIEPVCVVYSPRGYAFLRKDLSLPKRKAYRMIEWMLGRLPHITVACGTGELQEASSVSRCAILVPNMIDLEHLVLPPEAEGGRPLRVVMSGSIRPQKNFPLFAAVAERMQDQPLVFRWIGGGKIPPGLRVPGNVEVTGWVSRDEALAELRAAAIFMQTSLWEGLPIAMLEAMALQLPVLAMPGVGNSELVVDGVNGFLCSEPEVFERRLRALVASPEARRRFGEAGRAIVERRHSIAASAPLWKSVYSHYERYTAYRDI